jgi:hypothetical protein
MEKNDIGEKCFAIIQLPASLASSFWQATLFDAGLKRHII